MNGKTVVLTSIPATLPQHATTPCGEIWVSILLNILPPTVSMADENNGLSMALAGASRYSSRKIIFVAPMDLRKSTDEDFPVSAETSLPSFDISMTLIEPTPPVAPETKAGRSDSIADSCIFITLAAAVSPAVPIDIDSK